MCKNINCCLSIDFFKKMIMDGVKKIEERSLDGVVALVKNPIKEDSNMLLIENGIVMRFKKNGDPLCKRGGYIFLWNKAIFENVESFISEGCYSLSKYYDYFVQNHTIGTMEIEDIWDVDDETDVLFTNSYIEKAEC